MPRLDQIDALLNKTPDDTFLNFARAMELAKLGRLEESLPQFDRVVTLDPSYIAAHFQKGRALLNAGRVEESKAVLRFGIEQAQHHGELHAAGEMTDLLESI